MEGEGEEERKGKTREEVLKVDVWTEGGMRREWKRARWREERRTDEKGM